MTTPVTGFKVVIDTAPAKRDIAELIAAAEKIPGTFRQVTSSVASYSTVVVQAMNQTGSVARQHGKAMEEGSLGVHKLQHALVNLSLATSGVPGEFGKVTQALGLMAGGGGSAAALATVGLGVLVGAIVTMVERSKQLTENIKELRGELDPIGAARANITEANEAVEKARAAVAYQRQQNAISGETTNRAAFQRALKEEEEAYLRQSVAAKKYGDLLQGITDKRLEDAKRLKREQEEELRRLQAITDAALKLRDAVLRGDELTPKIVGGPGSGLDAPGLRDRVGLNAPGQIQAAPGFTELQKALERLDGQTHQTAKLTEYKEKVDEEEARRLAELTRKEEERTKAITDAINAVLGLAQAIGLLGDDAGKSLQGVVAIGGALRNLNNGSSLASQLPSLVGGIASVVEGVFASAAKAKQAVAEFNQARTEWDRSLQAFAGLFTTQDDPAKQLADLNDKFRAGIQQLLDDLGSLAQKLGVKYTFPTADELGTKSVAELTDIAKKLHETAELDWVKGRDLEQFYLAAEKVVRQTIEWKKALEENQAALEAQIRTIRTSIQQDLEVQRLRLEGHTAEADAAELAISQAKRRAEIEQQLGPYFDDATQAMLDHIDALEQEALAARQARQALEDARAARDLGTEFDVRSRRLSGDSLGADIADIQGRFNRERDRITDLFTKGILNQDQFDAWIDLLNGEMTDAINNVTSAYHAQAEAAKQLRATFDEDLNLREMRARGDPGADAYARQLDHEREIQRAIAQGMSEAQIERLRYIQGLEDEREAAKAAEQAERDRIRLLKEEAAATDDLNVRKLRAAGLDAAADDLAFFNRQKKEMDDAVAKGFSAGYIAELAKTQAAERDKYTSDRLKEQQRAFDQAASDNFGLTNPSFLPDSNATTNLAVGVSEGTTQRLIGIAAMGNYWLERIDSNTRELVTIRRLIAKQSGVDTMVADVIADAAQDNGTNPGN